MMEKALKWVVGLAIVSYVVVTLSLKVIIKDRTRPIDPAFVAKFESAMLDLEACKKANEELRAKLIEQADKKEPKPASPGTGEPAE